uniref:Uncharacterized protein n=1 Tax=Anguilla anguilla TaxID=7936 RepID=A0A0E9XH59_ANGAN
MMSQIAGCFLATSCSDPGSTTSTYPPITIGVVSLVDTNILRDWWSTSPFSSSKVTSCRSYLCLIIPGCQQTVCLHHARWCTVLQASE